METSLLDDFGLVNGQPFHDVHRELGYGYREAEEEEQEQEGYNDDICTIDIFDDDFEDEYEREILDLKRESTIELNSDEAMDVDPNSSTVIKNEYSRHSNHYGVSGSDSGHPLRVLPVTVDTMEQKRNPLATSAIGVQGHYVSDEGFMEMDLDSLSNLDELPGSGTSHPSQAPPVSVDTMALEPANIDTIVDYSRIKLESDYDDDDEEAYREWLFRGPGMGRSSWSSPIRLITAFGDRIHEMVSIVRGLEKFESESQVERFVNTPEFCPPQCGWLYPLVSQLRKCRSQPVVLLVLQCPKRNCRLNPQEPTSSCFTDVFIAALTDYFALHGIHCIAMDFRKECRRSVGDNRCPALTSAEFNVCGLATMGELYIAHNVYGIRILATVAISANACNGIRSLQRIAGISHLMGQVYYIPWHPRLIPSMTMSMSHETCRPIIKNLIERSYRPVIGAILSLFRTSAALDI
ncbi:uncharacterized protein FSUBG_6350 [Fusarium subglutinans]|uniref:Uncharacterized protein n=1 Tax=Gibberella subglutinans TaxID=42677 RepID=A0A8H5UZZ2_GIBSU|nr:uncharacterized protein FSUBG_6350 [Fusarium subglutinans]KAF5605747.1 hypothetical protein FSUBG_6350 [Fusarium subglutinans]